MGLLKRSCLLNCRQAISWWDSLSSVESLDQATSQKTLRRWVGKEVRQGDQEVYYWFGRQAPAYTTIN